MISVVNFFSHSVHSKLKVGWRKMVGNLNNIENWMLIFHVVRGGSSLFHALLSPSHTSYTYNSHKFSPCHNLFKMHRGLKSEKSEICHIGCLMWNSVICNRGIWIEALLKLIYLYLKSTFETFSLKFLLKKTVGKKKHNF